MDSQSAPKSLLCISLILLYISSAQAFNITKLLAFYDPTYSTFNSYLTQANLASDINRRQTITVLAVPNSAMKSLEGKSKDVIKDVMSLHVILDYFDDQKIHKLSKKTALLTTLFQSSGIADGQQGFLNVTVLSSGEVAFGSAVKGAQLDAQLVKSVAAQPYNISVLEVSSLIIPQGIDNSPPSPPPPPSAAPAPAPTKSKKAPAPTPAKAPKSSKSPAPAPAADSPAADVPSPAEAPADAPAADAPTPAAGPVADAPAADKPADDKSKSAGTRAGASLVLGGAVLVIAGFLSS
ncbi:hypothetical protein C5167_034283 [Papaver somniferum]|uniref:FAS1 domain-containing protein n=1 Tax=Papaver somniferum TaxID=3469 RepID=A0A4Y7KFF9_PAPSO|nr:fasciclin-like arabinogalactan protein 14 [Papaver somniferum]RZC71102.1 hypothetical protein C5167_034283 [Papaver somniferum]